MYINISISFLKLWLGGGGENNPVRSPISNQCYFYAKYDKNVQLEHLFFNISERKITHSQVCSRAENWWHISTQKPPNVGSSIAISEPIIAVLVSARGLPNTMKLGNHVQQPTQTG